MQICKYDIHLAISERKKYNFFGQQFYTKKARKSRQMQIFRRLFNGRLCSMRAISGYGLRDGMGWDGRRSSLAL